MKYGEINEEHHFEAKNVHGIVLNDSEEIRKKRWEMVVKAQNQAKKEIKPDFPFNIKNPSIGDVPATQPVEKGSFKRPI